jgi:hypothetical protein
MGRGKKLPSNPLGIYCTSFYIGMVLSSSKDDVISLSGICDILLEKNSPQRRGRKLSRGANTISTPDNDANGTVCVRLDVKSRHLAQTPASLEVHHHCCSCENDGGIAI